MVLKRPDPVQVLKGLRLLIPVILALLVLALLSGVSRNVSFAPREGATGAMRLHWSLWRCFLLSLGDWTSLVPAFLVLAWIVRKSPLDRQHLTGTAFRLVLGVLVYAPVQGLLTWGAFILLNTALSSWAETREILSQVRAGTLGSNLIQNGFQYGALVALLYAYNYYQREREKRLQLDQARLRMLRMQLNPHFLFNTLNAATTLMRRDVDTAERLILTLTAFLRNTLDEDGSPESPLEQELDMVRRYFEIEAMRFPGRLALEVAVEPALGTVQMPSFMLQPLVENALRHGLAPRASGGKVQISAGRENGWLRLVVEDDGLGRDAGGSQDGRRGLGLANTRERLAHLYGGRATLEAGPREQGGFRVSLLMPLAAS